MLSDRKALKLPTNSGIYEVLVEKEGIEKLSLYGKDYYIRMDNSERMEEI